MKNSVVVGGAVVLAVVGLAVVAASTSNTTQQPNMRNPEKLVTHLIDAEKNTGEGVAAIERAAEEKKYLFAFFWKEQNEQTLAMRKVFEAVMKKVAARANAVEVDVTAAAEQAIVEKFDLDRAPMPLVLALAPNGAITGGFPTEFEEEELLEAFVTACTEQCMKWLQDGKLVFLCIQNASTNLNEEAMQGVRGFKSDARFAGATEIVRLDPADTAEAEFLADLRISPETANAVTVFLAPPGVPIAVYEGVTSKDELAETLQKAGSGCCPGGSCGPGGCCPR